MKTLDIRTIVQTRMRERNLTAYRLAQLLDGSVSRNSVYTYLRGDRDMTGQSLGYLLAALDLTLR